MSNSIQRILHLTLTKKWFEMIASGEKLEEYRELKPYWVKRLTNELGCVKFDIIRFKNGYAKNAPSMDVEFVETTTGYGKKEWGGEDAVVYKIKLGKILNIKNYELNGQKLQS
jgi:hypothetical protein